MGFSSAFAASGVLDAETDNDGNVHLVWLYLNEIKYRFYNGIFWSSIIIVGYGNDPRPVLSLNDEGEPRILYWSDDGTSYYYNYAYLNQEKTAFIIESYNLLLKVTRKTSLHSWIPYLRSCFRR